MEQDYPGGRSLVRKAFKIKGVPEASIDISMSSITQSSYKQYEVCFKKWWQFCVKNLVDPFNSTVPNIIKFLTEVFINEAAHSSVNCYRSEIALLNGPEIATDPRMLRFFKGISKIRPSKPKYDSTWDPKIVLDYFTSKENNTELSLKDLSMKLICLLALVTGHRMQTFSLIRLENIELQQDNIEIKIPDPIKTSGPKRSQPVLVLPYFNKNNKVCAAYTLRCYIDKTKDLRKDIKFLFISTRRPYKAVTAQTLGHWVKETLEKCGLDTNIFTAHSTRHASTSTAKKMGIDIDTLRKTAGWTDKSKTFAKFYDLRISVDKSAFANAILNK